MFRLLNYNGKNIKLLTALLLSVVFFSSFFPGTAFALGGQVYGISTQTLTANDPGFTQNPLNIDKQWAIPAAGFDYAWAKTTGSSSNIVAIIDTGLDATHEDLQNLRLVDGYDFVNNQPISGRINSDDNGHGTVVAGILGASANNGIGVVGTNWAISIMPLKALDSSGKGTSNTVAQAITWATDHGANFINLSLGGIAAAHDSTLSTSVSYAFNKGVLIVAAAGNDTANSGDNLDTNPLYPVCEDNGSNMILGVTALDQNGLKPIFSNYGSGCVDVAAPGKHILTTINHDPVTKAFTPNAYIYVSGTSVAVPFVVGEAALIRALNPDATNVQIRDQILSTTDSVDDLNLSQCAGQSCRTKLGSGQINLRTATDKALSPAPLKEGDLITLAPGSQIYQLVGNQKRPVSQFVIQQRFSIILPRLVTPTQLNEFIEGPSATPQDGTLVKTSSSPVVYIIQRGQKFPLTFQVFLQRKFNFNNVVTLADSEVNTWMTGSLLAPAEGTIVRTAKDRTLYWVVGETLHPISSQFYKERGLNVFPIFYVSREDLAGFAKGEAYIR